MTQEQLLLEIFNGILELQSQGHAIFQSILDPEKETTWESWVKYHIPNMLQLLTIIVGIYIVHRQIQKQHESNLEAQNEKVRSDLKIQLRADMEQHIDRLNTLTATAGNFPYRLSSSFRAVRRAQESNLHPQPIKLRYSIFNEDNFEISGAAIEIIKTIEKYEIVLPKLSIFKTAMNVFLTDFGKAHMAYGIELLNFLPVDTDEEFRARNNGVTVLNRPLPTPAQEEELKQLGARYQDVLHNVGGWLIDLRAAIQNLALGTLFPDNHVQIRQPLDPECIVINVDQETIDRLNEHFENETEWGHQKREAEERVKQSMGEE